VCVLGADVYWMWMGCVLGGCVVEESSHGPVVPSRVCYEVSQRGMYSGMGAIGDVRSREV